MDSPRAQAIIVATDSKASNSAATRSCASRLRCESLALTGSSSERPNSGAQRRSRPSAAQWTTLRLRLSSAERSPTRACTRWVRSPSFSAFCPLRNERRPSRQVPPTGRNILVLVVQVGSYGVRCHMCSCFKVLQRRTRIMLALLRIHSWDLGLVATA